MIDKTNKATIQDIQRSIVTICIDNQFPELSDSSEEDSMGARMMLHGGGSVLNSGNRWNDKTLQVNIAWRGGGSEEDSMGARMMLHGGGSVLNSGNRWNDKTLQVNIAQQ